MNTRVLTEMKSVLTSELALYTLQQHAGFELTQNVWHVSGPIKKKKKNFLWEFLFSLQVIHFITWKLGSPLGVGIKPKDTIKPNSGRRKGLLLGASKENTEDLSQSRVSPAAKLGKL